MPTVLILCAQGMESAEFAPIFDMFGWGRVAFHADLTAVAAARTNEVRCSFGLTIRPDCLIEDVNPEHYEALVLPGGFASAGYFRDVYSSEFLDILKKFYMLGKPIAGICTGAIPIAVTGLLTAKAATTYHGDRGRWIRELVRCGAVYSPSDLVESDGILTTASPGSAAAAAASILGKLTTEDFSNKVFDAMGYYYSGAK